jgi:hypothetical protein
VWSEPADNPEQESPFSSEKAPALVLNPMVRTRAIKREKYVFFSLKRGAILLFFFSYLSLNSLL